MKMNKIFIITAIENMVTVVCFTILAIMFQKWWIVAGALLFVRTVKYKNDGERNEQNDSLP